MPLSFALAGVGSRFVALAIDTVIQVAVGVAVLIVVLFSGGALAGIGASVSQLWAAAIFVAVIFLLVFAYFAVFEIVWNGQTPGKRVAGIRAIKESGRPLTAAETIARNFLRIVDQLPGFYGIGVLVALLNSKNKRLGDFVAGSIVLRETPFEKVKPVWTSGRSTNPLVAPVQVDAVTPPALQGAGAGITIEELALIETFLHRRYDLAPEVRSRMAEQILERVKDKVPAEAASGLSTETILESLAHERRNAGYS